MKNHHTFTLIDGEFGPKESKELLFSVFKSKIHFHQMKNFSSEELLGMKDQISLQRINQLKDCLVEIIKLIESAEQRGENLEIRSHVRIKVLHSSENSRGVNHDHQSY